MKIILGYEKKIYFWPNILENNILTWNIQQISNLTLQ